MKTLANLVVASSSFIHSHFLWLLVACYVVAAVVPEPGLSIRHVEFAQVSLFGQIAQINLPMVMLAVLLVNAGLGLQTWRLKSISRIWTAMLVGTVANLVVPIGFVFAATPPLCLWLDLDEVQSILLGLALIGSMPIAGSSTAWSQNVDGSLALSLGLVLSSTMLSPLTTPMVLRVVGILATGDYAEDLRGVAAHSAEIFLIVGVVGPSLLGLFLNWAIGEVRLVQFKPHVKLVNWLVLLVLIYANASVCLPEAIAYPDLDFLFTTLGIAIALCALAFGSGWALAHAIGADPPMRAALMFGLGMNNNGAGLVLASMALAGHPRIMLPIIAYNLVQHLVAGAVAFVLTRTPIGPHVSSIPRLLRRDFWHPARHC